MPPRPGFRHAKTVNARGAPGLPPLAYGHARRIAEQSGLNASARRRGGSGDKGEDSSVQFDQIDTRSRDREMGRLRPGAAGARFISGAAGSVAHAGLGVARPACADTGGPHGRPDRAPLAPAGLTRRLRVAFRARARALLLISPQSAHGSFIPCSLRLLAALTFSDGRALPRRLQPVAVSGRNVKRT